MRWYVLFLLAALTTACAQSPTGPSSSAPASSLGAISDQGGNPPPAAGDVFCGGSGPLGNDGLHPNGSGYALIANKFRENIAQVFVVRGTFQ